MATPTEIRKGKVMIYNGTPHSVLEMLHRTQGRQAGFVQVTLRNLESGNTTNTKIRSTETVEFCHTETHRLEYSYRDQDGLHFMNPETFEDIILSEDMVGKDEKFLVETCLYDILYVDDRAVSLQLPVNVEMKVVEAPDAIKGDTVSNVQKPVTMETGLIVQVPLFIKKDEVIRVNTEDGSYAGRA